jgi:hypothetical protein
MVAVCINKYFPMTVPLDLMYHYIHDVACKIYGGNTLIYRFWPHGSKNITNLSLMGKYEILEKITSPQIWCNDQEPLDHEYYCRNLHNEVTEKRLRAILACNDQESIDDEYYRFNLNYKNAEKHLRSIMILKSIAQYRQRINLNYVYNAFTKSILLHSEKRSAEVQKYIADDELIPVYYWNHAIVARDWYRYAQYTTFTKNSQTKKFLIYSRAWGGTREYRIKFADLLQANDLVSQCQTTFNTTDPESGIRYQDHVFKNPQWKSTGQLEDYFDTNTTPSSASADFVADDYNNTDIEVVLETLFDDGRLHLTEKSLRPMACAQPFILAAPHGSLEYLREYGFKTFDSVWDETYDTISDPVQRLQAIVNLMCEINAWDPVLRQQKLAQAQAIADHNRAWFFDQAFSHMIENELETNLKTGLDELKSAGLNANYIAHWPVALSYPEVADWYHDLGVPTDHRRFLTQLATSVNQLKEKISNKG